MKIKIRHVLLLCASSFLGLLGVFAVGCSHAPLDLPNGTVIVDNSNPKHVIVEFNGSCPPGVLQKQADLNQSNNDAQANKKKGYVIENGKTYYFSSEAERDRIVQNFASNSRY